MDFLSTRTINQLRHVEIDVTNAYCQIGCCRLHCEGYHHLIFIGEPLNVTFLGARNEVEERVMMESLQEYFEEACESDEFTQERIKQDHNIKFDPEDDVWAKWKME
jgi:hypothetical protein